MPEPSEPRQRPYVWAVRLPDLVHIKMWFMKCGAQQQASVFSRRTKLLRWRLTCFQLGSIPDQGKFFIYIFVLAFNFLRLYFSSSFQIFHQKEKELLQSAWMKLNNIQEYVHCPLTALTWPLMEMATPDTTFYFLYYYFISLHWFQHIQAPCKHEFGSGIFYL